MKICKRKLYQIITEETSKVLQEATLPPREDIIKYFMKTDQLGKDLKNIKARLDWVSGQINVLHRMMSLAHPERPWGDQSDAQEETDAEDVPIRNQRVPPGGIKQ